MLHQWREGVMVTATMADSGAMPQWCRSHVAHAMWHPSHGGGCHMASIPRGINHGARYHSGTCNAVIPTVSASHDGIALME